MFVGIVGSRCSGKSCACTVLADLGFSTVSLSDILREKARERHLPERHGSLFSLANELRAKFGPAALMDDALNRVAGAEGDLAVDGIITGAEIARLRQERDVLIIGLDADRDVRYGRARNRQSETGKEEFAASRERFVAHEESTDDPSRPPIRDVLAEADVIIMNDGTLEELASRIRDAVERFRRGGPSSSAAPSP